MHESGLSGLSFAFRDEFRKVGEIVKGKRLIGLLLVASVLLATWTCTTALAAKRELEVAIFECAYGMDFLKTLAAGYEKEHPDVKVNAWGNPRVWEQLRPRFIEGNPPDLMIPGWGFSTWPAIAENQILALDEALAGKSYDKKSVWKNTLQQLESFQYKGKTYGVPYFLDVFGWWYNEALFKQKGWKVPKTWDELWKLCDKMKSAGIAPFATCGLTPDYIVYWRWGVFEYYVQRLGGIKVLEDALNMVPGAWKHEAILKAADIAQKVNRDGYFLQGTLGLSHTDSQVMFFTGKAAMIPVGSWVQVESQDVIPKDFKLRFMVPPAIKGGKGDQTAIHVQSNTSASWFVPAKAKNPDLAIDFLKYATSLKNAMQSTKLGASAVAVNGAFKAVTAASVLSSWNAVAKAKTTFNSRVWETRYPPFDKDYNIAIYDLVTMKKTPQQFAAYMEEAAEKIRQDKNTVWFPVKLSK